jgi:clan AA aspartic protease
MSTFTIRATLIHPDDRERSVTAEFLVDTGATYSLLPREIVDRLGLTTPEELSAVLASGERVVYGVGEVRVRLDGRERTAVSLAGPPGCRPLLDAFTLEVFALAADPVNQRLILLRRRCCSSPPPTPTPPARGRGFERGSTAASCSTRILR